MTGSPLSTVRVLGDIMKTVTLGDGSNITLTQQQKLLEQYKQICNWQQTIHCANNSSVNSNTTSGVTSGQTPTQLTHADMMMGGTSPSMMGGTSPSMMGINPTMMNVNPAMMNMNMMQLNQMPPMNQISQMNQMSPMNQMMHMNMNYAAGLGGVVPYSMPSFHTGLGVPIGMGIPMGPL